jgi:RNA polymerase sigma-70 factor (ECF subfamily)
VNRCEFDLEALRNGDHEVFQEVYLHYASPVKDFLAILTRSEEQAQELTQDIFVAVWEKRERIDPAKSFKGYLYTIARNAAFKLFEQRKVHERYVKTPTYADIESYSPDDELIAGETAILIDIAIERMPPQRKKIFEMSRLEGLKATEIAERLNLSRHTVDNHLAAAKKDLKELLALFAALFLVS